MRNDYHMFTNIFGIFNFLNAPEFWELSLVCLFESEEYEVIMLLALVTSFQIISSFIIHYSAAILSEILIQNLPEKITFSVVETYICPFTFPFRIS